LKWSGVRTRNGMRLRIFVPSSGRQILLCPMELEALTWQDHELFSHLLATPDGPAQPPGVVGNGAGEVSGDPPVPPGAPGVVPDRDAGGAG
jgi:hypothetical protein